MNELPHEPAVPLEPAGADVDFTVASETDRREALRKIGRYSAYAAPAMMALFSKHALAS
jgi:hypothetical protein